MRWPRCGLPNRHTSKRQVHQNTHSLIHFLDCYRRAAVAPHSAPFVNGMGGWGPIIIVGMLCGAVFDARAQDLTSHDATSRCGAEVMPAGRVDRVIDGRSFVLDDGREIRLASLEVPAANEAFPAGAAARAALASMLAGETVALRSAAAAPDRYGRAVAYVFTAGEPPRSVAHAMLARGHARVGAAVGDPACAAELLSQERVARTAKIGLWGEPRYAIMAAGDLTGLVAGQGHFAVVEGKVLSVREQRRHHICEFRPPMVAGAHGHHIETSRAHLLGRRARARRRSRIGACVCVAGSRFATVRESKPAVRSRSS